jgi:hypothetical protein
MRAATALASAALVMVAVSAHAPVDAISAPSRTVDRTVACSVGMRAGVRKVEIHARSGTRLFGDPTKWKFLANAYLTDPSSYPALTWVSAGWPPVFEPGQKPSNVTLSTAVRCTQSSARVPLTTKGLSGFAASPLDDEYHCVVPKRVLVRVKATFRAPTSLRLNRKWGTLEARGVVREGVVVVSTEAGKAVALAIVNESGKARLNVADNCEPDLIQSDG